MRIKIRWTFAVLAMVLASQTGSAPAQVSREARLDTEVPTELVFLSYAKFKIPFSVNSNSSGIATVQLWVSTDEGRTWQMQGTAQPEDKDFSFQAAAEGKYLFSVQTVDLRGGTFPSPSPPLRVIVDTTKPQAAVQADTNDNGQLVIEVRMFDEHIDLDSATLRIRTDRDSTWQAIQLSDVEKLDGDIYQGMVTIDLPSCREVGIAFSVLDKARNSGEATSLFGMPRTAAGESEMTLASSGMNTVQFSGMSTSPGDPHAASRLQGADAWQRADGGNSRANVVQRSSPVELRRPGRLVNRQGGLELEPSNGSLGAISEPRVAEELPAPPQLRSKVHQAQVVEADPPRQPAGGQNDIGGAFFCKSRAFSLDYAVEALGGGTLDDVELWGTEDGGRTWQQWGSDPDRQSPFEVQVGNDGLFGFRMALVASNGLVSNRPKEGDSADVWINVDTSDPTATITRAVYGEGDEDGTLVIDYTCQDSHLVDRPITLSYSESLDGPWETIASGQKNSGLYIWKPSPSLPNQIYLRLEVADKAGNVGIHRLELPVETKGLRPHGRIRGFRPILNEGS